MSLVQGRGANGKIIKVSLYDEEGETTLMQFSPRQRAIMLLFSQYLNWDNRWENIPDDLVDKDARDTWIDQTKDRLMQDIDICAEVIKCFQTDEDVQNAFAELLANTIQNNTNIQNIIRQVMNIPPTSENPTPYGDTNLNISGLCDAGRRANAAIELVDWLHANNQDWLEKVSSAATPYTRSKVLGENLPNFGFGVLGELVSEIFTFFSAAFRTNYEAAVDNAYLDRLYYDIWCLSGVDCELSVNDLYRLMYRRLGNQSVTADTFAQAIVFTITGEWTGANFADIMMFIQVGAFKFLSGFLSYRSVTPLSNAISQGYDDTDDAWEDWISTFGDCPNCAATFDVISGSIEE